MSVKPRGKLSARPARTTLVEEAEDAPLQLLILDLALPCRRYLIEHKVAEPGKVSVTAEFLLRLVRAIGDCSEEDVQAFFGYSRREMAFVLNEVEEAAYVRRSEGRLSLTVTGQSLFKPGNDEPLIYEVERKTVKAGFDLISMAPADWQHLSYFEQRLPELPLLDKKLASEATREIPKYFRRFFREFSPRKERDEKTPRALYSVDSVTADERFSSLVRVNLVSTGMKPASAEIDLSDWKSEYDLTDRENVGRAVTEFVNELEIPCRPDDIEAYELLLFLAPEYLKEWTRRDGLSVARFYRHAFTSMGDLRANRQTAPIVGSSFGVENARRLFEATAYGLRRSDIMPKHLFWIIPNVRFWGSTSVLVDTVDSLVDRMTAQNEGLTHNRRAEAIGLTIGRPTQWIEQAFSCVRQSDALAFPNGFEMLFIPDVMVMATVHAPIGVQAGLPVPLGFVSFDERVVARARELLDRRSHPYGLNSSERTSLQNRGEVESSKGD